MNIGRGHAQLHQCFLYSQYHFLRPADECLISCLNINKRFAEGGTFLSAQAATKQWYVHILPAQNMKHTQAFHVYILQRLYGFFKNNGIAGAVAIYQREAAARLVFQHRLHNAHDRGDAAACRKGKVFFMCFIGFSRGEFAHGRHYIQHITGFQLAMREGRELALLHFFDGHTQLAVLRAHAYGVRPTQLGILKMTAKREVLPRRKPETLRELAGNLQRYRYTIGRFGPYILNC